MRFFNTLEPIILKLQVLGAALSSVLPFKCPSATP